jgi:hypothetical protein
MPYHPLSQANARNGSPKPYLLNGSVRVVEEMDIECFPEPEPTDAALP